MTGRRTEDFARLRHQSRGRELRPEERGLAQAMVAFFGAGGSDFAALAARLEHDRVPRPSGRAGPWSCTVLEEELRQINQALDAAYAENGFGA